MQWICSILTRQKANTRTQREKGHQRLSGLVQFLLETTRNQELSERDGIKDPVNMLFFLLLNSMENKLHQDV